MEEKVCPCCGRHCPLDNPHCERGIEYANGKTATLEISEGRRAECKKKRKERYRTLDTDNKLICNIRDMGHTVRALSDGKSSQSRILIILNTEGAITQSMLTELLNVQPGTVSEVIGKLEKSGLVVREESEQDRRTSLLRLTEEGVSKALQASEARKSRYEEMFGFLTEIQKSDLLALLEKVNDEWQRKYGDGHVHCDDEHRRGEYMHGEHRRRIGHHGGHR